MQKSFLSIWKNVKIKNKQISYPIFSGSWMHRLQIMHKSTAVISKLTGSGGKLESGTIVLNLISPTHGHAVIFSQCRHHWVVYSELFSRKRNQRRRGNDVGFRCQNIFKRDYWKVLFSTPYWTIITTWNRTTTARNWIARALAIISTLSGSCHGCRYRIRKLGKLRTWKWIIRVKLGNWSHWK